MNLRVEPLNLSNPLKKTCHGPNALLIHSQSQRTHIAAKYVVHLRAACRNIGPASLLQPHDAITRLHHHPLQNGLCSAEEDLKIGFFNWMPKQLLFGTIMGTGRRGRPVKSWNDCVREHLDSMGLTCQWWRKCPDRKGWKGISEKLLQRT